METKTFTLDQGALVPSITEQMQKQNIIIEKKDLKRLQKCADAIVRLHLSEILSYSEVERARKRLFIKVRKAVRS